MPMTWDCDICLDTFTDYMAISIEDDVDVCQSCLPDMFKKALQCEANYPVRVSEEELHPSQFAHLKCIEDALVAEYSTKEREYKVAPQDRIYCQQPVAWDGKGKERRITSLCNTFLGARQKTEDFALMLTLYLPVAKCPSVQA